MSGRVPYRPGLIRSTSGSGLVLQFPADFPDWKRLAGGLSDAEGEVSVTSPTAIGYNPRYLSALMKAAARWGACAGTPNPLRVQRFDAAKSLQGTVVNPELGRLLLLLMPVRFSDGGPS